MARIKYVNRHPIPPPTDAIRLRNQTASKNIYENGGNEPEPPSKRRGSGSDDSTHITKRYRLPAQASNDSEAIGPCDHKNGREAEQIQPCKTPQYNDDGPDAQNHRVYDSPRLGRRGQAATNSQKSELPEVTMQPSQANQGQHGRVTVTQQDRKGREGEVTRPSRFTLPYIVSERSPHESGLRITSKNHAGYAHLETRRVLAQEPSLLSPRTPSPEIGGDVESALRVRTGTSPTSSPFYLDGHGPFDHLSPSRSIQAQQRGEIRLATTEMGSIGTWSDRRILKGYPFDTSLDSDRVKFDQAYERSNTAALLQPGERSLSNENVQCTPLSLMQARVAEARGISGVQSLSAHGMTGSEILRHRHEQSNLTEFRARPSCHIPLMPRFSETVPPADGLMSQEELEAVWKKYVDRSA